MIRAVLSPKGPYSLRVSGRLAGDACRVVANGTLRSTIRVEGRVERVRAAQRPDGHDRRGSRERGRRRARSLRARARRRPQEFLRRFANDPLLGETVRRIRGLRPVRTGTVAQSLLRAVAGQLILAKRARADRALDHPRAHAGARRPARRSDVRQELGAFSPAQLRATASAPAAPRALVRLCRAVELERLKQLPTDAAAARLGRERGLGPWSVGVVCLEGLGRFERGLLRDLGLIKLASELWGRRVEAEESRRPARALRRVGRARERLSARRAAPGSRTLAACPSRLSCTSPTTPRPRSRGCSPTRQRAAGRSC